MHTAETSNTVPSVFLVTFWGVTCQENTLAQHGRGSGGFKHATYSRKFDQTKQPHWLKQQDHDKKLGQPVMSSWFIYNPQVWVSRMSGFTSLAKTEPYEPCQAGVGRIQRSFSPAHTIPLR